MLEIVVSAEPSVDAHVLLFWVRLDILCLSATPMESADRP